MRALLFILVTMTTFSFINAQTNIAAIQQEIDQTVWKDFSHAFQTSDGPALNATYADKVLRVTPNGIDTKEAFKAANLERMKGSKDNGQQITLDFWLDDRKTNETTSYEVGYYRIGFSSNGKEPSYSYGQFHIVLEKINGHWKITQDWDTTTINGTTITAEDFAKGTPLKF